MPEDKNAHLPYRCCLCGGDAFKGISRDAAGRIQPILFPDEIKRPHVYPEKVMFGVFEQLRPVVADSQFVCKGCNEGRLTPAALAPLRGRVFDYVPSDKLKKKGKGADPGDQSYYAAYCGVM